MKFLIVDDSSTMRRIVVNSLHRIGYTSYVEAAHGFEALAKFDSTIGFVISDWNMPQMSGLELARELRARPDGASVPLLMITTRASTGDITSAAAVGVSGYILKPFQPPLFKQKIDELIAMAYGQQAG